VESRTGSRTGAVPSSPWVFTDPPVVEAALGIQFSPLSGWAIPHFGLLWESYRQDFPAFEDQMPLPPKTEVFDTSHRRGPSFELLSRPAARCWFIDRDRGLLIQVQNGRFIQNWRKEKATKSYPKYEKTRSTFSRDWDRFTDFLKGQRLGDPLVQQCEITYVNHLEIEKGWQTLGDLKAVTPVLSEVSPGRLPSPEGVIFGSRYVLPEKRGRLYVQMQSAIGADGKELLLFTLTARGAPSSSQASDLLSWFDFGRTWIHEAFEGFVTPEMRVIWGGQKSR